MIQSLIIGIGALVTMMLLWVVVQTYWAKTFAEEISDEDVLAERRSCGSCGCSIPCKNVLENK
jgi:hypothetical protein